MNKKIVRARSCTELQLKFVKKCIKHICINLVLFISYAGKFIMFKIVRDSGCSLHRLNILDIAYYNIKVKKLFLNLEAYVKYLNYSPNLRKDRLSTPTSILGLFMSYVCF